MSLLAEQNVIGCLILDSASLDGVYGRLTEKMFTSKLLGRIYLEYLRGYDNNYTVNMTVLEQKLRNDFETDEIMRILAECSMSVAVSGEIVAYAKIIENDYKAKLARKIIQSITLSENDIELQIVALQDRLGALLTNTETNKKSLSQIAKENKDKYFKDNEEEKIYTGFDNLDDILGGLEGGDMIVIGARPSVGKSAFVTQITSNLASQGKRIGFYNLEMQEKQVYERFVVSESGISLTRLKRAKAFLGDEEEKFQKANERIEKMDNIVLTTGGGKTVKDIRHESKHMDYDIIIIDYLQLLSADTTYRGNRAAEVGEISREIKILAMELNVPIIALSQLNRVSEQKETKEPTMAELREAGNIEQDASVIILMWNISQEDRSKKGLKVDKNRNGVAGVKEVMNFNGDLMRFEETEETIKDAQQWAKEVDDDCPFN